MTEPIEVFDASGKSVEDQLRAVDRLHRLVDRRYALSELAPSLARRNPGSPNLKRWKTDEERDELVRLTKN